MSYSTLQLISLRATDTDTLIKKFQFKGKPILGVHSNRRVIVVVFKRRVLVMDAATFGMRFYIKSECAKYRYTRVMSLCICIYL